MRESLPALAGGAHRRAVSAHDLELHVAEAAQGYVRTWARRGKDEGRMEEKYMRMDIGLRSLPDIKEYRTYNVNLILFEKQFYLILKHYKHVSLSKPDRHVE